MCEHPNTKPDLLTPETVTADGRVMRLHTCLDCGAMVNVARAGVPCRHLSSYPTERSIERVCCSGLVRKYHIWFCPDCEFEFIPQDLPARR